jgi:Centrosome microtubule-binding domain of Cep57
MDSEQDVQFDDTTEEGSFDDTTKTIHKDINVHGGDNEHDRTQGSNYSSIFGHGEMDRMRELVADVRAKQQERLAAGTSAQVLENDTVRSTRSVGSAPEENQSIQRKSSKKGLTGILKNRDAQDQDDMTGRLSIKSGGYDAAGQDHTAQSITTHQRRHSETSVRGRTSSRRHIVAEEMTSAFILPDITIHGNSYGTEHKALSAGARKVLDNLAQHDGHNCTVCSRVASFETENASIKIDTKKTIRIEKPIPVSDRMPVAGPYEDEPTMRPLTSPGLALATVMKGLQDELAHLKMELAQYQSMYNKYDMSLGMRKRKAIKTKIENLLKAIDTKADQIYGLYDVLEGQKQSGQQLSEEDVEITLQSIGVDVDALKQNKTQDGDDHSESGDSGDDSELDLPWEGIEDTTGTESVKERRQSWRL